MNSETQAIKEETTGGENPTAVKAKKPQLELLSNKEVTSPLSQSTTNFLIDLQNSGLRVQTSGSHRHRNYLRPRLHDFLPI